MCGRTICHSVAGLWSAASARRAIIATFGGRPVVQCCAYQCGGIPYYLCTLAMTKRILREPFYYYIWIDDDIIAFGHVQVDGHICILWMILNSFFE